MLIVLLILHKTKHRFVKQAEQEFLPHVYTSTLMAQGNILSQFGTKYTLPMGTTRHDYEVGISVTKQPDI